MMQRYLDPIELLALNISPSYCVRFLGYLDHHVLARAFKLLCIRYPVLRGHIYSDVHGHLLCVSPDHEPRLSVRLGDETTVEDEVSLPWDPEHEVSRLTLIQDTEGGFVLLRMDHAIADGASKMAMFQDLWRLYTDMVNGLDVHVQPMTSLPSSPCELLDQRWSTRRSRTCTDAAGKLEPFVPSKALKQVISLSKEYTDRIRAAARGHNLSMHAVICGAILAAQRDYGKRPTEATPMWCLSPVNLRHRVTPRVGATETTVFGCQHKAELMVRPSDEPLTLSRKFKEHFDRTVARRQLTPTVEVPQIFSSRVDTPLEQHVAKASVSNMGVISRFVQSDRLSIVDFQTPVLESAWQMHPQYAAYTYEGRLNIPCVFASEFFAMDEVEQLEARIRENLDQIVASFE